MASSSSELHESADKLGPDTVDRHRAIVSIMEELEAVDWYDQRVAASDDESLREVLAHNRDEEKEHAAMTLEWLRRHDPALDQMLRRYLFTSGAITEIETETEVAESASAAEPGRAPSTSLNLGSLAGKEGL